MRVDKTPPADSAWRLRVDLASAKVLIWAARVGRDAELTPDTHLYLATRYERLARIHRLRGRHCEGTAAGTTGRRALSGRGMERPAIRGRDGDAATEGVGRCGRDRTSESRQRRVDVS